MSPPYANRAAMSIETYLGQIGATVRFGNDFWLEVACTISTASGDNTPTVVQRETEETK